MKAIIEVAKRGSTISAARQQLSQAQTGQAIDYRLFFESPYTLFNELTPIRLELLNKLSQLGTCSIEMLAKTETKNVNLKADVSRLEELGLIESTTEGIIFVPFDAIEIVMPLAKAA
jgi:predicted transcriptional regulator